MIYRSRPPAIAGEVHDSPERTSGRSGYGNVDLGVAIKAGLRSMCFDRNCVSPVQLPFPDLLCPRERRTRAPCFSCGKSPAGSRHGTGVGLVCVLCWAHGDGGLTARLLRGEDLVAGGKSVEAIAAVRKVDVRYGRLAALRSLKLAAQAGAD